MVADRSRACGIFSSRFFLTFLVVFSVAFVVVQQLNRLPNSVADAVENAAPSIARRLAMADLSLSGRLTRIALAWPAPLGRCVGLFDTEKCKPIDCLALMNSPMCDRRKAPTTLRAAKAGVVPSGAGAAAFYIF